LRENSEAVVSLAGEVDISFTDRAQVLLEAACAEGHSVVVDLSEVTYIDCHAVAMLARTRTLLAADHRTFHVIGASGLVFKVVAIAAPELLADPRAPDLHLTLVA
jgi:anti-anti-sigma factor